VGEDGLAAGDALGALGEHGLEADAAADNGRVIGGVDQHVVDRLGVADTLLEGTDAGEDACLDARDLGEITRHLDRRVGAAGARQRLWRVPTP
jgi:hypothetical protein